MGSVNISIKKEAYNFLHSLKTSDKSFSEVILDFKKKEQKEKGIMKFFGRLKDSNWKEKEEGMRKFREDFNKH